MHMANKLNEMLHNRSNKLISLAVYLDGDRPPALRAIQGHSAIAADPTLMESRLMRFHTFTTVRSIARSCPSSSSVFSRQGN